MYFFVNKLIKLKKKKELVRKSVLCPPNIDNIESLKVPPPPPPSSPILKLLRGPWLEGMKTKATDRNVKLNLYSASF